ncbi:type II CRISPR RNA-guided endonuclease Cas9 [Schaalia odontolytica]
MRISSESIPGIRYRVGIDVGLKSIGFCAVEVDRNDQPIKLLNSMVFIHDAGVDPNENKAAKSRKLTAGVARRTRRLYRTRHQRLVDLDRVLSRDFGWPLPDLSAFKYPTEPWHVRARLLDGYIADDATRQAALSIALRHIARHRGWRNPYAKVETLLQRSDPSDFLEGLNVRISTSLGRQFPVDATPGQLVNAYLAHPDYVKEAGTPKLRGPEGVLAGKLHQSDNAEEIRRICEMQKVDRADCDRLIRAVFQAKSPKGSAKERGLVGHDELPGQGKHVRAEKAHPAFQKFRIVSVLANLRIREGREERPLTPDELQGLTDFLLVAGLKQQVTWQDLADNLGIERSDLRGTAKASFDGSPVLRTPPTDVTTEKILACKVKWLKEWWKAADDEQRGYFVDAFSNSGGSEDSSDVNDEVAELLEQATEDDQLEFEKISLPQGRAAYSLDSLRRLTDRMLRDGVDLHTARRIEFNVGDDWKPAVEPIGAPTGNTAVDRVLKQVSRWLHAATERWGEPTAINIEHARDGLGSEKVARELMRDNEKRRKANAAAVADMAQQLGLSGKVRRSDQIRYFALQRQNCQCLYCGVPITYSTAEMDHIVPRADGSSTNDRSNLAAVCRTCNHKKGKIPFAAWASSDKANDGVSLKGALERVTMWERDNGMSPKQFKQLQKEVKARLKSRKPDEEFDGRSMESVAWMAVELRTRIEGFYRTRDEESVPSVGVYRGQLTAEARKASGFESRVNLIGGRGKTRFDRRHHAMDALVIALMNPSVSRTLALRVNMRDAQRLAGLEETWKNFYGKPGEASQRFESWRESMLRGVELFNIELSNNSIPFVENIRLRVGSSVIHDATVHSFCPPKRPDGEQIITKGYGEQHRLSSALPVELIDRAETPALWTALTRCPDFDPKKGLPENPLRSISVNGTRVGPSELLNFFGSSAACLKVRGGYVELGSSIHHARIYRIDGKKTMYAMVRVFQVDLLRLKNQDVFTTPLKPSTISVRTAEPKIRQALADGTATQIGWLVEGDELRIDTSKYSGGFIGEVLERYPEATSWRVAGFMTPAKLRIKPLLLSKEGFIDEQQAARLGIEPTSEAVQKTVDTPGWLPAVNVLFGAGGVRVIRRNCLGEERWHSTASLPVSMVLE